MFENIGQKIKTLASVICWIGIIGCSFWGISVMALGDGDSSAMLVGMVIIGLGILASWTGSFLLYGFGELIYQTTKIARNTENGNRITKTVTTQNTNATTNSNIDNEILANSMKCFSFALNAEKKGMLLLVRNRFLIQMLLSPPNTKGYLLWKSDSICFIKPIWKRLKFREA